MRSALPTLSAVTVIDAGTLEPGDVLIGPQLARPARLWWRVDGPGHVVAVLPSPGGPSELVLDAGDPVLVAARPRLGQAAPLERAARLRCAAAGALWLRRTGHPLAPSARGTQLLVEAFADSAGLSRTQALRHARAATTA